MKYYFSTWKKYTLENKRRMAWVEQAYMRANVAGLSSHSDGLCFRYSVDSFHFTRIPLATRNGYSHSLVRNLLSSGE